MTVTIIELNDSDIRVGRGSDIVLRSPGYAVTRNGKIEVGRAAERQARLNPRAIYDRYWSDLNQDPLQNPSDLARHHADLAYTHLLAIHEAAGKPDDVLFAVPGSFSNDQLALLLGLVEASPFQKAVGLVDVAVAAAAPVADPGNHVYIDLHLHRTIVTHLSVDDYVTRGEVQVIDGAGLAEIVDASASAITDLFIAQTRFDPQHYAETEQLLYEQIPQCLEALRDGSEAIVELQYQGTQYRTKVPADTIDTALNPLYQKVVTALPADGTRLVGDRWSALPGFVELLSGALRLGPTSVLQGCSAQLLKIHSSGPALEFVTSLPASAKSAARQTRTEVPAQPTPPPQEMPPTVRPATHVMRNNCAYTIADEPLYLSDVDGASRTRTENSCCFIARHNGEVVVQTEGRDGVLVNGRQVEGRAAARGGDVIGIAGTGAEYLLISVLD